jgi:protein-ribulosamine 3-kinase
LDNQLKSSIEKVLSERSGSAFFIEQAEPVAGGSINNAFRIKAGETYCFVKSNSGKSFPGMFSAEKKGLQLLADHNEIKVPRVIHVQDDQEESFLILEYVELVKPDPEVFREFGRGLASMHRYSNNRFGLDHDNYIGSLKQSNKFHSSWAEFFIEERLAPQLKLAFDNKKIGGSFIRLTDQLFSRINNLFPSESSSLIHGDLWSGNFMATRDAKPCFYDPAVYYGHREMDIAMTRLFGGFEKGFYEAYNENFPLENGWSKRVDLCNLYPLLVHVNLFGGSYAREAEGIVKRFV